MPCFKHFFFFLSLFIFSFSSVQANPLGSGDITSSVTIGSTTETITAPTLISPADNSLTNNRYESFIWQRATSTFGINHYTLYLDNLIIAPYITNGLYQDNSLYTVIVSGDRFNLQLKFPLSEGSHTTKVLAYTNQDNSSSSSTHTFTVDSTIPLIILQAVDKNIVYWASHDPSTIPPTDQRHFNVTTSQPLLTGKTEANANLKLALACPPSTPSCQDQSYTGTVSDGNWKHRFYHLEPGLIYTAYLSATDPAGNSNIFPAFTITYTPISILTLPLFPTTPTPTLSPTPPTTPPTPSPTRPPEEIILLKEPPPPPPPPTPTTPSPARIFPPTWFLPLASISLLLHFLFTAFGAHLHLLLYPRLLGILFLPPFLFTRDDFTLQVNSSSNIKPLPFTTLKIFSLEPVKQDLSQLTSLTPSQRIDKLQPLLHQSLYTLISDSQGSFSLKLSPDSYLITANHPGYSYPDRFIPLAQTNNQTTTFIYHAEPIVIDPQYRLASPYFHLRSSEGKWCLPLNPQASLTPLESLQQLLLSIRSLPLFLSFPVSLILLYFTPSYITLSLTFSSSLLILNQHLHPLISKPKIPQF